MLPKSAKIGEIRVFCWGKAKPVSTETTCGSGRLVLLFSMPTMTLKLDEPLFRKLEAEAERRCTTKSAVLRQTLEQVLANRPAGSLLDQMEDLVGSEPGPSDLGTNPKHLRSYGE